MKKAVLVCMVLFIFPPRLCLGGISFLDDMDYVIDKYAFDSDMFYVDVALQEMDRSRLSYEAMEKASIAFAQSIEMMRDIQFKERIKVKFSDKLKECWDEINEQRRRALDDVVIDSQGKFNFLLTRFVKEFEDYTNNYEESLFPSRRHGCTFVVQVNRVPRLESSVSGADKN